MKKDITPPDSRYVPLTQQPACCVPTCIQIIMLRHKIPLIPAEEIGYHLGLVVSPGRAWLFYNVRTSEVKPSAGYGTRIYLPEFEINTALKKLSIPLTVTKKLISTIKSSDDLASLLKAVEKEDKDVLLCFHHGTLIDDPEKDWGHLVVFDRFVGDSIRIVDPSPDQPKWRIVSVAKMFEAMKKHGNPNAAGVWEFTRV